MTMTEIWREDDYSTMMKNSLREQHYLREIYINCINLYEV